MNTAKVEEIGRSIDTFKERGGYVYRLLIANDADGCFNCGVIENSQTLWMDYPERTLRGAIPGRSGLEPEAYRGCKHCGAPVLGSSIRALANLFLSRGARYWIPGNGVTRDLTSSFPAGFTEIEIPKPELAPEHRAVILPEAGNE